MKKSFQKNIKEYKKWENSDEGINYNLNCLNSDTYEDGEGEKLIINTLKRLPKKIREKVLDEVIFVFSSCAGYAKEICFQKFLTKEHIINKSFIQFEQPIIVLNFQEMKKNERMDTIAHETAHFILGHCKMKNINSPKNEREADDLIEKWGFKRAYKEKEYQKFEKRSLKS